MRTYSIAPTSNQIQSSTSNTITRTYVYDANGSITSNGVLSLAYDGAGRLSSAQGSPHYYNALGQRTLTKIGNNMPRWYVYDESGRMLGTYFRFLSGYYETVYLGDLPIAVMDVVNGIKYVDTDHLGTPRAISDAAQRTIYAWNPGTFGTAAPSTDPDGDHQSFNYYGRFPGQYYSSESTLHLNGFRDYDPQTGRYVEIDPIGLGGGLNTYAYARSAPMLWADPLGLINIGGDIPGRPVKHRCMLILARR